MRLNRWLASLTLAFAWGGAGLLSSTPQAIAESAEWAQVEQAARGQTVYWNAWGGDEGINNYIAWVGERLMTDHGITLIHVKLADTAEAVRRVVAEKSAGRDSGGSVDLIWINGENFQAMKDQDLLFGPITDRLPNYGLIDVTANPAVELDFTIPTDDWNPPGARQS